MIRMILMVLVILFPYIFYNKQYDKLKMLYWHKNGFNLLYKRLEKERFKIPKLVAARCICCAPGILGH
jgi:hypothetical protein